MAWAWWRNSLRYFLDSALVDAFAKSPIDCSDLCRMRFDDLSLGVLPTFRGAGMAARISQNSVRGSLAGVRI